MKEYELKVRFTNGGLVVRKGSKRELDSIISKLNSPSVCFIDIEGKGSYINKSLVGEYSCGEGVDLKPEKERVDERKPGKRVAPPETRSENNNYPY